MILRLLLAAALLLPAAASAQPEAPKKKAKAKPAKKVQPSKYKTRELTETSERSYRFNEKGEPIVPKPAAPKKKKGEPLFDEEKAACSEEQPCAPRSPDADAL